MEIIPSVPQRRSVGLGAAQRQANIISLYNDVAGFQKMSLDQFAALGWDRVKVLQKFEEIEVCEIGQRVRTL